MGAEPDLLNGFAPRIVPVIRDALAKNAGNKELEKALRRLGYLLVFAKHFRCDDPAFDALFERELMRALPDLRVTEPIAELVVAALELDMSNKDFDPRVPRQNLMQRCNRIVEAIRHGQ